MTLYEFFDPHNIEHVRAYQFINDNGHWPQDFWNLLEENNVKIVPTDIVQIGLKMADAWVEHFIKRYDTVL